MTVVVQSVKERQLPPADDDFAQMASEFDTLEELREDLREQARRARSMEQGVQARDRLLEALLEAVDVPVPQSLVDAEVHRHLEAEGRLEDEDHRAEVTEEAGKALRTQLLLEALAEQEEVSVSQQELIEYLVATAPQYGMDPNQFAQAVDQAGQIQAMVGDVARRKALAVALEHATVTDASGRAVDLDALVPSEEEDEDIAVDEYEDDEDEDSDDEAHEPAHEADSGEPR